MLFLICIFAGGIGLPFGVGGGPKVVSVLASQFNVDVNPAIGTSIVVVIATPSLAALVLERERITNLRM